MRPCLEGLCLYSELKGGVLTIDDVARMHDALDVRDENQRRYNEATAARGNR